MINIQIAANILKNLAQINVQNIIICAGARNAPFVYLLEKVSGVKVWNFFEERSAGFFALGLAQSSQLPVAVITTSGTAVAELLPAAIEASLTKTPLIFITADRPSSYRGSGAPQAIEQVGLFANYVEKCLDIEAQKISANDKTVQTINQNNIVSIGDDEQSLSYLKDVLLLWSENKFCSGPLHLNVCMDEPLIDGVVETIDFNQQHVSLAKSNQKNTDAQVLQKTNLKQVLLDKQLSFVQPLILVGALTVEEARSLVPSLLHLQAPIYAEAISNLRQFAELERLFVQKNKINLRHLNDASQASSSMEKFDLAGDVAVQLTQLLSQGICKSVIRVGGVPTLRLWRDLESKFKHVPVCSFTRTGYSGLSRPSETFLLSDFFEYCELQISHKTNGLTGLLSSDAIRSQPAKEECDSLHLNNQEKNKFTSLLFSLPHAEVSLLAKLSSYLGGHHVYLGNSLPIREWDMVAAIGSTSPAIVNANRGANGIDGQISSFLGLAEGFGDDNKIEHWGIFGDLTTMYDLVSPWALKQMSSRKIRIVVINNQGGMIFKNMFGKELFLNSHQQHFKKWAEMWDFNYFRWTEIPDANVTRHLPEHCVIEIVPDSKQSEQFWLGLKQ